MRNIDFLLYNSAYQFYPHLGSVGHKTRRKKKGGYRTHYPCAKQAPGTMHCGYYVCRYISAGSGVYTRFPTEEPSIWKNPRLLTAQEKSHVDEQTLYLIGSKLLRFIMREFIWPQGKYHDRTSESHNIPTFVIISEMEAPWIPLRKIGRLRRRN